ncbi:MAG: NAD(+)/NADH kinase [Synergistales bacterium]|nr:NAD(+)/NADH kinase [Synergistales bacterium]
MNIGLLVNTKKKEALAIGKRLVMWGQRRELRFCTPPYEASFLGIPETPDKEWKESVDFAVVVGGDGTFLRAARYVQGHDIPLFGVNAGRLGFLAVGNPQCVEDDIENIIAGKYGCTERHLLEGRVWRESRLVHKLYALNDLVVTKGAFARLIYIEVHVGDRYLNTMPSDGMIVASPTGSTAYALSAGGPIVPPHVPCLVLVPICPHTLYARPLVLGEHDSVTLVPLGEHRELILTQDGQLGYEILPGDRFEVFISPGKTVQTISPHYGEYYELLREKFLWGKSQVNTPGE